MLLVDIYPLGSPNCIVVKCIATDAEAILFLPALSILPMLLLADRGQDPASRSVHWGHIDAPSRARMRLHPVRQRDAAILVPDIGG